ncbi:MAG: nuclear transport factor 2 family protein [Vulcanimicrobiaceae bacterium]
MADGRTARPVLLLAGLALATSACSAGRTANCAGSVASIARPLRLMPGGPAQLPALPTTPAPGPCAGVARSELEVRRNASAIQAIEAHWQRAERTGDAGYLQMLLAPEYAAVGPHGMLHDRRSVLAAAPANRSPAAASPDAFEVAVAMHGNTAIVTGVRGGARFADAFYYAHGRWYAWYSQETPIR